MNTSRIHFRSRTVVGGAVSLVLIAAMLLVSADGASAVTPPGVGLGTADGFNVLASTTVTNTGNSVINNGDVGLNPGTSVVGFPPATINNGVIHATDARPSRLRSMRLPPTTTRREERPTSRTSSISAVARWCRASMPETRWRSTAHSPSTGMRHPSSSSRLPQR